jgi:hypothetical protein
VTFQDKNNTVHIVVSSGAAPSIHSVASELARQRRRTPSLRVGRAVGRHDQGHAGDEGGLRMMIESFRWG